jgi:toxin HigB-1
MLSNSAKVCRPRISIRLHRLSLTGVDWRGATRKLLILDGAESIQNLRVPPGNRLEKLSGDRTGEYSIRINDQWRICFKWLEGHAHEVEITDYHG